MSTLGWLVTAKIWKQPERPPPGTCPSIHNVVHPHHGLGDKSNRLVTQQFWWLSRALCWVKTSNSKDHMLYDSISVIPWKWQNYTSRTSRWRTNRRLTGVREGEGGCDITGCGRKKTLPTVLYPDWGGGYTNPHTGENDTDIVPISNSWFWIIYHVTTGELDEENMRSLLIIFATSWDSAIIFKIKS